MRCKTHALLAIVFLLINATGCAATRNLASNVQRYLAVDPQDDVVDRQQQATNDGQRQPAIDLELWQQREERGPQLFGKPALLYVRTAGHDAGRSGHSSAASRTAAFDFSHPRVDKFVTRFQTDLRDFYRRALERSGRWVEHMSSILRAEGLPEELAYLPLIESGYRTSAVSRAGAVGPWQFIRGTGRRYSLRIDRYVDERRDPEKSTAAAARYLKDLYAMFGDWHLSLAAYNTGEGTINRILKAGHAADFWEMIERGYLRRETRNYVPRFLAALQIAETPEAYGFEPPKDGPLRYDLVTINERMRLSTVAKLSGSSTGTIKELNPALTRGIVPPRGYAVRLPAGTKPAFEAAYASAQRARPLRVAAHTAPQRGTTAQHTHIVQKGETVASIARRHQVSVEAVLTVNGIIDPRKLQTGHALIIPGSGPTMVAAQPQPQASILD